MLFKINCNVIKVMAHGKVEEMTVCPITGNKKEPSQWISKEAYRKFGYKAVLAVKRAVERERNRLPAEVFQYIKEVARKFFEKGDKSSDRDIAIFLIDNIVSEDTPLKGVENAVRAER